MNPGNTNSQFCQWIAGKYGTSFFHRRRFPLLVHLLYRRGTGEPMFRPPVILERNITVLSRILNRLFQFHHHLHFNVNAIFQKYEAFFRSTLPANQERTFLTFPRYTSYYQRQMNLAASPLPPAGQDLFEKNFTDGVVRYPQKLLIMKSFWEPANSSSIQVSRPGYWSLKTLVNDDSRMNMTFQAVDNRRSIVFPYSSFFHSYTPGNYMNMTFQTVDDRRSFVFSRSPVFQNFSAGNSMNITYQSADNRLSFISPHSILFREVTGRMLMRETVHKEKVTAYRYMFDFTLPPGAATTTAIERAAAGAVEPETAAAVTAAASAASYTSPAVLTPLTGRIPLNSLAHLTPLTSRDLAHNPTTVTAAKAKWFNHAEPSDQFRGKRPGTPTSEHPQPGPGAGAGVRKSTARPLESLERYDDAASTTVKTSAEKIINETASTHFVNTQAASPPEVDLHRLTDQVYRMLEKKIKTERERRGW